MKHLKRFDEGIARGEALIATSFLVTMIFAGCMQALMRHFATDWEATWANDALAHLEWVDAFLQKGTLWLAFLGASLATREGRHIGIDLFPRLAPPRTKLVMRAVANLGSAVVAFFLGRAFWSAVLVNADERPAVYEVFGDSGPLHVCDATAAQLADASAEAPGFFCAVREALAVINVPVETGNAALQLIVPAMFIVIAVRLLANAIGSVIKLSRGELDDAEGASPHMPAPKPSATEGEG